MKASIFLLLAGTIVVGCGSDNDEPTVASEGDIASIKGGAEKLREVPPC